MRKLPGQTRRVSRQMRRIYRSIGKVGRAERADQESQKKGRVVQGRGEITEGGGSRMSQRKMADKQKRFADEYLIDCNATRAYMAAYPAIKKESTAAAAGARLLRNDKVKKYIADQMEELKTEKVADAQEVIEFLSSVLRGEEDDYVLKFIDGDQRITEMPPNIKDRLKAAELLAKRYGLLTEKVNIEGQVPVMIVGEDSLE